jgi:hypothetical protein
VTGVAVIPLPHHPALLFDEAVVDLSVNPQLVSNFLVVSEGRSLSNMGHVVLLVMMGFKSALVD